MNVIRVAHGSVSKLAVKFKCSKGTVSDSLSGKSQSGLARTIRAAALNTKEYGGVEMQPVKKSKKNTSK